MFNKYTLEFKKNVEAFSGVGSRGRETSLLFIAGGEDSVSCVGFVFVTVIITETQPEQICSPLLQGHSRAHAIL